MRSFLIISKRLIDNCILFILRKSRDMIPPITDDWNKGTNHNLKLNILLLLCPYSHSRIKLWFREGKLLSAKRGGKLLVDPQHSNYTTVNMLTSTVNCPSKFKQLELVLIRELAHNWYWVSDLGQILKFLVMRV